MWHVVGRAGTPGEVSETFGSGVKCKWAAKKHSKQVNDVRVARQDGLAFVSRPRLAMRSFPRRCALCTLQSGLWELMAMCRRSGNASCLIITFPVEGFINFSPWVKNRLFW